MAKRSNNNSRRLPVGGACSAPTQTSASGGDELQTELGRLNALDHDGLQQRWRGLLGGVAPKHLPRWLLERLLAYRLHAQALGDLDVASARALDRLAQNRQRHGQEIDGDSSESSISGVPSLGRLGLKDPRMGALKPGSVLVREHGGQLHHVMVLEGGFSWNGATYSSLSQLAFALTGTRWNGHRFFGLERSAGSKPQLKPLGAEVAAKPYGHVKSDDTETGRSPPLGAQP